jgi:hypothetical protein
MPNAAYYVPPIAIVGVANISFGVLAVLLVHSACTTLVLALFSFPPTVTPQRLTFSVKETRNHTSQDFLRLTGALAKPSPFGWGGAIKSRERDSLGFLRFALC